MQRVWRVQREHAHRAWASLFGDEPLPQLASAAEWTQWVVNERQRAASDMEQRVAAEKVCGAQRRLAPERTRAPTLTMALMSSAVPPLRLRVRSSCSVLLIAQRSLGCPRQKKLLAVRRRGEHAAQAMTRRRATPRRPVGGARRSAGARLSGCACKKCKEQRMGSTIMAPGRSPAVGWCPAWSSSRRPVATGSARRSNPVCVRLHRVVVTPCAIDNLVLASGEVTAHPCP